MPLITIVRSSTRLFAPLGACLIAFGAAGCLAGCDEDSRMDSRRSAGFSSVQPTLSARRPAAPGLTSADIDSLAARDPRATPTPLDPLSAGGENFVEAPTEAKPLDASNTLTEGLDVTTWKVALPPVPPRLKMPKTVLPPDSVSSDDPRAESDTASGGMTPADTSLTSDSSRDTAEQLGRSRRRERLRSGHARPTPLTLPVVH